MFKTEGTVFLDLCIETYKVHRKPTVAAVPVEQDPKTDAGQMTDIIFEVSAKEPVLPTEYELSNALTTPVVPTAKANRAPSRSPSVRKPKVIEQDVVITPSLDEVQAEVTLPIEEAKAEAKVECPDCGKLMAPKLFSVQPRSELHG